METGTDIPKIIHRIWLDDPLPSEFAETGLRWKQRHPNWRVWDWRSTGDLPPLRNQELFDEARNIYPKDWKRFQSDLVRYELIELYGGVYADTDTEPRCNVELLLRGNTCVFGYSPKHIDGVHPITQCFFAAVTGHPFISELVDGLPHAVDAHGHKPLAQSIGPWHVTRTLEKVHPPRRNVHLVAPNSMFGEHGWVHHFWNNKARKQGKGVR